MRLEDTRGPLFTRGRVLVALAALGLALAPAAPSSAAAEPSAHEASGSATARVQRAAALVQEVRGVGFESPIRFAVLGRADASERLESLVARTFPKERAEALSRLFRHLDLLAAGYPLRERVLEVLREQVAAFYDPFEDLLVIVADEEGRFDESVLQHELVHALADQHHRLESWTLDPTIAASLDRLLARRALAEGEALLVEELLAARARGLELSGAQLKARGEAIAEGIERLAEASGLPGPLADMVYAPYALGARFVFPRYAEGGMRALDALWRDPPESSAELLGGRKVPRRQPPPPELAPGERPLVSSELGLFGLRRWLAARLPAARADEALEGLLGDFVVLARKPAAAPEAAAGGERERIVERVVIAARFAQSEQAARFAEAADAWMRAGGDPGTRWRLTRRGSEALLVISPPAEETTILGEDPWEDVNFSGPPE